MSDFAALRQRMVDNQIRPADVTKFPLIAAMQKVRREAFVPPAQRPLAYMGENLPLAPGRVLLDPRSLAKMIDALDLQPAETVLCLGTGLGYSAAILSQLTAAVIAVEEEASLAAEAERSLAAEGADNVAFFAGPLAAGAAKHGPYEAMLIEGGIEVLPGALADQLREGGRIAALFIEGPLGTARLGRKTGGVIHWRDLFNAEAPVLPGFEKQRGFAL